MHPRTGLRLRWLLVLVAVALVTTLGTALAGSNSTVLPRGAILEVSIDEPLTSWEFLIPADKATRDVLVKGKASVGKGVPDATFAYGMDFSGSTGVGSGTGCAPIIDCEKKFIKALNKAVIDSGSADEIGLAIYATTAATADMSPDGGNQIIIAPNAGDPDYLNQVVDSGHAVLGPSNNGVDLFTQKLVGFETNCTGGLQKMLDIVNASSNSIKIGVFVSDGLCDGSGGNEAAFDAAVAALAAKGAVVHSVAAGAGSSCDTSEAGFARTLRDIANGTGGQCFQVADPGNLPSIIPDLVSTSLDSLQIEVDGGGKSFIPNSDITPDLPQPGAVSVDYATMVLGLTPGDHTISVTANGSDTKGTGSVTRSEVIHLYKLQVDPMTDTNELLPGAQHTITATLLGPLAGLAPVMGRTVNFEITAGPNVGAKAAGITGANGMVSFTYLAKQGLAGLGTDHIDVRTTLNAPLGETAVVMAMKTWQDTTPPEVGCLETQNPHGKTIPPAGSTTLPGAKGGQNEDGYYILNAKDFVDPNPQIFVLDTGSGGTIFGPFPSGTEIKYTEDPTAVPTMKRIGSTNGQAGDTDWHIIGNGDPAIYAVDAAGNVSPRVLCKVPPPPK